MCTSLKIFVLMVVVVAVANANGEDDNEDNTITMDNMVTALESFTSGCDPVPEREYVEEFILNKEDARMETKCLRYCLLKQFDVLAEGEERKMDQEKTVQILSMGIPDKEDELNAIIEQCDKETATITENCEYAHSQAMCALREMRARDFKLPEIKQ